MMGGTQGHNYELIASYPLDFLDDDFVNEDLDKELRAAAKSHLVTHDDIDDLDEDDDGYY